ncbi:hypothetical protein [Bosea sp. BH3]|uniref:hypothetical protein n=1 Tax=Bosea sp. BH3 TaxID=2871701 RepID=UPI0021CB0B5B|nr:hypothetical protein [Bosea sp. BH3]MCU4178940.1 hypothetical protein [Bosea sp. BH3]
MTAKATKAPSLVALDRVGSGREPRLSTDFLNRYNEALMLIEMSAVDDSVVADLKAWRSLSYREHFASSPLRVAASALAAYDRIEPARTRAFEDACRSMDRVIQAVTALLAEQPRPPELPIVITGASAAVRKLIAGLIQFINANGEIDIALFDDITVQAEIDALLDN